jgi:hypothetical protein
MSGPHMPVAEGLASLFSGQAAPHGGPPRAAPAAAAGEGVGSQQGGGTSGAGGGDAGRVAGPSLQVGPLAPRTFRAGP